MQDDLGQVYDTLALSGHKNLCIKCELQMIFKVIDQTRIFCFLPVTFKLQITLVKGQGQDTFLNHKQSLNQIRASTDSPFQSYGPDMSEFYSLYCQ